MREKLQQKFRKNIRSLKIYMTGMVMMNNGFSEASINDMTSLVPISFLIMMVMLFLMIRGFAGTALTMVVIILSDNIGNGGWRTYWLSNYTT